MPKSDMRVEISKTEQPVSFVTCSTEWRVISMRGAVTPGLDRVTPRTSPKRLSM